MSHKTLVQLYTEHEGKVSDKWALYLTEYERIFNEYRDRPVRMLEIGVQNGGSLEIWSKYFKKAKVFVGCDINPDCSKLQFNDQRIALVVGDANTVDTKNEILSHSPKFDIIIDDGSHVSSDIVKSFAKYFSELTEGGVFIAEDLHCSYWQEYEGGLYDPFSSISFFKSLADVVNFEHWGVEKKRNDIFKGFFKKYGFRLDEELLKQVHSVEFINSVCVVRKTTSQEVLLGSRIMVGNIESVVKLHDVIHSKKLNALPQINNFWSMRAIPPTEELINHLYALAESKDEIARFKDEIARFNDSLSWKVTAPLRYMKRVIMIVITRTLSFFKQD